MEDTTSKPKKLFAEDQSRNPPPINIFEALLRRFARTSYLIAVLFMYILASLAFGAALAPALWAGHMMLSIFLPLMTSSWLGWFMMGFTYALAFFVFGLSLMVTVCILNFILPTRFKSFKGGYYTIHAVPWFLHNGLFYLVRFTFLPFATLTPFGILFLKGMGMKIGKHAFINTEYISDPSFIELGDDVTLGGSVRIFAHYGGGGNLVIAPIKIHNRATLGAGSLVMGDVQVGEGAVILPHSVLLPGARVPAEETWGGVPAQPINRSDMLKVKQRIRGLEGSSS
jgi:acetyltransferase-like isoleucine patch superfamily enzyme